MDWVEAIGYQHEVLHTAVLDHLLRGPAGVEVARRLTGDDRIECVEEPEREARLRPRRSVDLAATLKLADGTTRRLGVETKVDSAWKPQQLRETVPDDACGVLLAVGLTALAVSERDLELGRDVSQWRLIGPGEFVTIVREVAPDDPQLARYASHLEREAVHHRSALEAVSSGAPVEDGRDRDALAHWAYFHEVIRYCPDDDAPEWERSTLRSGPLMTRWVVFRDDDSGDYLEFMGQGQDRSLCVKTYARRGTGDLRRSWERLGGAFDDLGPGQNTRTPGPSAKTCTAARWSLSRPPIEAARLAQDLRKRLEQLNAP